MMIECVPVDKEIGDMAPIYFKVCSNLFDHFSNLFHLRFDFYTFDTV
jgi:hypothetical protein